MKTNIESKVSEYYSARMDILTTFQRSSTHYMIPSKITFCIAHAWRQVKKAHDLIHPEARSNGDIAPIISAVLEHHNQMNSQTTFDASRLSQIF